MDWQGAAQRSKTNARTEHDGTIPWRNRPPTEAQLDYLAALTPPGQRLPMVRSRAEASAAIDRLKQNRTRPARAPEPPKSKRSSRRGVSFSPDELRLIREARARMAPRPDFLSAGRHRSSRTPRPG